MVVRRRPQIVAARPLPPREGDGFESPDHPATVPGVDRRRRLRIETRELLVEDGDAFAGRARLQARAQLRVASRSHGQWRQRGPHVEPGPPHHESPSPRRQVLLYQRPHVRRVLSHRELLVGVDEAHSHVGTVLTWPRRAGIVSAWAGRPAAVACRLVGEDREAPVDLHRVARDDAPRTPAPVAGSRSPGRGSQRSSPAEEATPRSIASPAPGPPRSCRHPWAPRAR